MQKCKVVKSYKMNELNVKVCAIIMPKFQSMMIKKCTDGKFVESCWPERCTRKREWGYAAQLIGT